MLDFDNLPEGLSDETVKLLRTAHESMTGTKAPQDRPESAPAVSNASDLTPTQLIAKGIRSGALKSVDSLEGLENYFRAKHQGGAE